MKTKLIEIKAKILDYIYYPEKISEAVKMLYLDIRCWFINRKEHISGK